MLYTVMVQGPHLTNLGPLLSFYTAVHGILLNSRGCTNINHVLYTGWGEEVRLSAQVVKKTVMSLCWVIIPDLVQPMKGVVWLVCLCQVWWVVENAGKYLVFTVGVMIEEWREQSANKLELTTVVSRSHTMQLTMLTQLMSFSPPQHKKHHNPIQYYCCSIWVLCVHST